MDTNIDDQLLARLNEQVRLHPEQWRPQGRFARISKLKVDSAIAKLAPAPLGNLPDQVVEKTFRARNCTGESQSESFDTSVTVTVGQKVTVTKKVSASINIKVPLSFGDLSAGVSVDVTRATEQSFTQQHTEAHRVSRTVPPKTDLYIRSVLSQTTKRWPFSGDVIVSGEAIYMLPLGFVTASIPVPIESVLPKKKDRSFQIEGDLLDVQASDFVVYYAEKALQGADCPEIPPVDFGRDASAMEPSGTAEEIDLRSIVESSPSLAQFVGSGKSFVETIDELPPQLEFARIET